MGPLYKKVRVRRRATALFVALVTCGHFSSECIADEHSDAGKAATDDGDVLVSPEEKILRGIRRLIEVGKYDAAGQAIERAEKSDIDTREVRALLRERERPGREHIAKAWQFVKGNRPVEAERERLAALAAGVVDPPLEAAIADTQAAKKSAVDARERQFLAALAELPSPVSDHLQRALLLAKKNDPDGAKREYALARESGTSVDEQSGLVTSVGVDVDYKFIEDVIGSTPMAQKRAQAEQRRRENEEAAEQAREARSPKGRCAAAKDAAGHAWTTYADALRRLAQEAGAMANEEGRALNAGGAEWREATTVAARARADEKLGKTSGNWADARRAYGQLEGLEALARRLGSVVYEGVAKFRLVSDGFPDTDWNRPLLARARKASRAFWTACADLEPAD